MDIFKLVGSIYVDNTEANKSIQKTGDNAEKTGSKLGKMVEGAGKMAIGVGAAAAGAGAALFGMAEKAAENLDAVDKGSQRMKVSAESFQEMSHICDMTGVSMSTMEKAAKSLEGTDLNMDDAMASIYELGTAEERSAKAAEIFGDAVAYQMTPMLNASAEEMAGMKQEAHDLGLVMSEDSVKAGAAFGDQLSNVKDSLGSVVTQIGVAVMPVISELLGWILDHMPEIQATISKVTDWIVNDAIPVVIDVINAIKPVAEALFKGIKTAWNTIGKPLVDTIISLFNGDFKNKINNAFESIKNKAKAVFEGLKSVIKAPINTVIGYLNGLIRGINALKIPDWVPVVGGSSANLATIPLLAKGGDVAGAGAAIVGEAGPELLNLPVGARVTPLNGSDLTQGGEMVPLLKNIESLLIQLTGRDFSPQIVMDSGALVGAIAPSMDTALGRLAIKNARGVK